MGQSGPDTSVPAAMKSESIYTTLRDRICTNHYPPGTILNETEISREFSVSRTPVRTVLQRLGYEGLVQTKNGVGTFVTEADDNAFDGLYKMRMKLSELIGVFADPEKIPDYISRFEELKKQSERLGAKPDYKAIGEMNIEVFNALQDMITNDPLRELSALLYYRTARIWHKTIPKLRWTQEAELVTAEIREIFRALNIGDLEGVGFIRRNFVFMAHARLRAHLQAE